MENVDPVKAKSLSLLIRALQEGDGCAEAYDEDEALRLLGVKLRLDPRD